LASPVERKVWTLVSRNPLRSLWNFEGVPMRLVARNSWRSFLADNLPSRAAELGFYFLFAVFPCLVTATSILGLAARSASTFYYSLLEYLAIVIPSAAMGTVLETFRQTTASVTAGKLTFGLVFTIWSASVGFSAIQDGLNVVYKVKESRSYLGARISAIGVTLLLLALITLILASLLGADLLSRLASLHISHYVMAAIVSHAIRILGWCVALMLLSLFFAAIYYFAPDVEASHWHWLTPGAAIGILGCFAASIGFRVYLHFFNSYSVTYGSLGAVIVLLTWFYLCGLMLLVGAEVNSEIEAAVVARRIGSQPA
jgi:membrane protein